MTIINRDGSRNPLYDWFRWKHLIAQVQTDLERLCRLLRCPVLPAARQTWGLSAEEVSEAAAFLKQSWEQLEQAAREAHTIEGPLAPGLARLGQGVSEALEAAATRCRKSWCKPREEGQGEPGLCPSRSTPPLQTPDKQQNERRAGQPTSSR